MTSVRTFVGACCAVVLTVAAACGDAISPTAPPRSAPLNDVAGTSQAGPIVSGVSLANVCLDIQGGSATAPAAGAPLQAWQCHGGANQQLTLNANGTITAYGGALCLDVWGAQANDGDNVVVWTCHGGTNQKWTYTSAGQLQTSLNGKCLDLWGAQGQNGARIEVWSCHGGSNQKWTLPGASASAPTPPPTTGGGGDPSDTNWTFCSGTGTTCSFLGRRTVRLGGPNGPYVQQVAYGWVPCAVYGFGGQNPAPGQSLHCDYGTQLTTMIPNPMPGMGIISASTVTVPLGSTGTGTSQVQASGGAPVYTDGTGSFRTTCGLSHYAFNDPIARPGQPGTSHLHAFFGNTAVDANTTPASVASTGNSTCLGGILNRTGYWVPALADANGNIQTPADIVVYYKTGYNMDPTTIQALPTGLRMIAGDMRASSAQSGIIIDWGCRDRYTASNGAITTACAAGDAVRLSVTFPQCWDGVNLDSPDHKSHMAYPTYRNPPQRSTCPADHPVAVPVITEHVDYAVSAGARPSTWRLSSDMYATSTPGGYSAHADWMNGWDPTTMQQIVRQCLNRAVDCQVGLLGDGRALF